MDNLNADFSIESNEPLEAQFTINPNDIACTFEVYASGTVWGSIAGELSNQTDLQEALDSKQDVLTNQNAGSGISITEEDGIVKINNTQTSAEWGNIQGDIDDQTDLINILNGKQDVISDLSTIRENAQNGNSAYNTIQTYGDIVTYNAAYFATAEQGSLADSALQTGDNISELVNNAGYITNSALSGYATETWVENKGYITGVAWGDITGTLSNQTDLQTTLNAKVTNNATGGTQSIALGTSSSATQSGAISLGYEADATSTYSMAIGWNASASNTNTIAIGKDAKATASGAIALGTGSENNTASSFQVGSYQLLDLTTGLIPDARISSNIARTSDIPSLTNYVTTNTAQTISGSKAFSQPLVVADNNGLASGTILSNKKILQRSSGDSTLTLNNADNKLRLVGSETRPQYNSADLALYSDLPTLADLTTQTQLDAIDSGANATNIGQITTNANDISTINGLIPAQATTSNQLADKSFVNSSIATNTANFIGTFSSISDLESYVGTVTNNDYAFVINSVITDNGNDWVTFAALDTFDKTQLTNFDYAWVINGSNFDLYRFDIVNQQWDLRVSNTSKSSVTLNTAYNRYKATVENNTTTWAYEYTLNNSSFTATQWAAINSGITSSDVSLIGTALQPNDNISELNNDSGYITGVDWGDIGGTLSDQTDLQSALGAKYDASNPSGFITGITSSDVTTALGYTPYDSSNPNGYTSNVGTVTSVNNVNPVSGNVTLPIPTDTSDLTNGAGFITGITSSDVTTALGYTPYNSTNPNGYITASALNGYATETWVGNQGYITGITSSDVTTALGYTPLSNSTKYGSSLSYSSNVLQLLDQDGNDLGSSVTIQSSPDIDNKSITTNSDDELQTVAVIDQNNTSNGIKTWTGTKAQYDAIVTKDANTLYNIIDDTDVTFQLLELIYPIGSIYIGTMSVCPLQALGVGTWQLVAVDRVLQGATDGSVVGTTVEAGLPDHKHIDGYAGVNATSSYGVTTAAAGNINQQNGTSTSNHPYTSNASDSNSIYGNSNTVQPPAYLVNIWERIS